MSTDIAAHSLSVLYEGRTVKWVHTAALGLHLPHGDQDKPLLTCDDHFPARLFHNLPEPRISPPTIVGPSHVHCGSRSDADNTLVIWRWGFLSISLPLDTIQSNFCEGLSWNWRSRERSEI